MLNQQYTRVSPGIYKGANGQIIRSARNPNNIPHTSAALQGRPMAQGMQPGQAFNPGSALGQPSQNPINQYPNVFNPGNAYGSQQNTQVPNQYPNAFQPGNAFGNPQVNSIFSSLAQQNAQSAPNMNQAPAVQSMLRQQP